MNTPGDGVGKRNKRNKKEKNHTKEGVGEKEIKKAGRRCGDEQIT